MEKKRFSATILIMVLSVYSLFAQESRIDYISEADTLFNTGIQKYELGLYDSALRDFRDIVSMASNQKADASLYMICRCLNKKGNIKESLNFARNFIDNNPFSPYRDDARFLQAENYYKLGKLYYFFRELLLAYNETEDERLKRKLAENISNFYHESISKEDFDALKIEFNNREIHGLLDLKIATAEIEEGNYIEANAKVNAFLNEFRESFFYENAVILSNIIEEKKNAALKIGVLLPLRGYHAQEGTALLRGAEFAVREFNRDYPGEIELVVKEDIINDLDLIENAEELADNPNIMGIFGPVDNYNTLLAGLAIDEHDVPMVSPLADMNDLYKISNSIFQSHTDLSHSSRVLARYAVEQLGLKTFAILAPANSYGIELSDNFAAEVDKHGGRILYEDWYFSGINDFGKYFEKIRTIGLDIMMNDTIFVYADSLFGNDTTYNDLMQRADSIFSIEKETSVETDTIISIPELDSIRLNEIKDSLKLLYIDSLSLDELNYWKSYFIEQKVHFMREEGILDFDSLSIPVTSIDAVFFPAEEEDLIFLAPQVAFYNFQTQLLGGDNWSDEEILGRHSTHLNGMVFFSDTYLNPRDDRFINFRDSFRKEMRKDPDRHMILGYDSMNLIITAIKNGARTRKSLLNRLSELEIYRGIGSDIIFNKNERVNSYTNILRFRNGSIRKLN